ncbi:hypothetical protein [Nitratireductor pacificus]|uniref:Uncharacterized protein n=1 Tax=Nitratireductor pacificus pht-3B TaxID=391937 RepID=K2MTL1_9HYPH|nr:hypothetical protein [Nitratireductor pacificus]EKF20682.1 hypothetical protein NA2_02819 [Nitratireductor pacificus pht-3B]
MDQRLNEIDRWHELFDELCSRAGYSDTASLAGRFCAMTNGGGQHQYETALRNLNNWRSGRHIPRQRSMRVLSELLRVAEDPELLARWNTLYQRARQVEEDTPEETPPLPAHGGADTRGRRAQTGNLWTLQAMFAGALLFLIGMGAGALVASDWRPWGGPADDAPMIRYDPELTMTVGESRIIHGERGDCGKLPREWDDLQNSLPSSMLGTFSDGGLVRRNSKYCKGLTPARGIRFTATKPGTELIHLIGDLIKMTVVEKPQ